MPQNTDAFEKFFRGIAHDVNNLFSSIIASTDMLKAKLGSEHEVDYLIANIENCSKRATELTRGLLNYGQQTPRRKSAIRISSLLAETATSVSHILPEEIRFITDFDESLPDIIGNSTELFNAFFNLCKNASEAIDGNGTIVLSASKVELQTDSLNFVKEINPGSYINISVKDTGIGIDDINLKKIFEPYYSTKSSENVSGIGLFNVYGIVKAHNGYIDVYSTVGVGTTFSVYLPFGKKKKVAKPEEPVVILADDEEMLRELLAELLEASNYYVIQVDNGCEVLRLVREELIPDLIIIDNKMPCLDGIEVIKQIREFNKELPIILSSGKTNLEEEIEPNLVDAILQKPYEFGEMLEVIKKVL